MGCRIYDIAGHIVSLERPEDKVWKKLGNLTPFETSFDKTPIIEIRQVEELKEEAPEPLLVSKDEGFTMITLGKTPSGCWYMTMAPLPEIPVTCRAMASEDFSRAEYVIDDSKYEAFSINNVMMLVFALRTAPLMTLECHASVVVKEGRGFIFLGRSGTGKSTHSRLWLENIPGTHLLNDDNPVIRVMEDGSVRVFGSPWSGKTPCYRQESAEAAAIVRLSQEKENRIKRLGIAEAYASMYPSVSGYRPERSIADGLHKTITGLVSRVPCWHLGCLPDKEAAQLCFGTVYGQD